jgi:hypothetical protein
MDILKVNDISVSELEYSNPITNTFGGQSIFITNNGQKMRFQTPKCRLENGISQFTSDSGDVKLSIVMSLDTNTIAMEAFKTFLEEMDTHNVSSGAKNSLKWFKKHLSEEVVTKLYRPQFVNNKIKAKVVTKKGEYDGDVFDKNGKKISIDCIKPGCKVRAIIECVGMYFIPNEFGLTWKAVQLKVEEEGMNGYSFIEDEDPTFEDVEPTV